MGYIYFKDTISAANGLFAKKIDDCIYLSVGINTSNLFENAFNCGFYMSQSLTYSLLFNGIHDASASPFRLLSEEEYKTFRSEGVLNDVNWWHSDDAQSIEAFKESVRLTEPRFINDLELRSRIVSNEEAKHQYELSTRVQMFVKNGMPAIETQFVPKKEIDGIPLIWFAAAEHVQKDEKYFNKNVVYRLAADAYRRLILDKNQCKHLKMYILWIACLCPTYWARQAKSFTDIWQGIDGALTGSSMMSMICPRFQVYKW